jgi:hypothetical protein
MANDTKMFEVEQQNTTDRWTADMGSDSWLSKNIRPMALIAIFVGFFTFTMMSAFGYNAQTNEYGDMVKAGIIDPTKVVRLALQNAASVAGLLITTEAMVADLPEKKAAAGGGQGGMGGMGDMDF